MIKSNTIISVKYLPTDIIHQWKRASLCANMLTLFSPSSLSEKNIISSLLNECLEYSTKHGMNKNINYKIELLTNVQNKIINLQFFLLRQQVVMFKSFIKKIKSINNSYDFEKHLFQSEFADLGFSIFSLLNQFNSTIKLTTKKSSNKNILNTSINIIVPKTQHL